MPGVDHMGAGGYNGHGTHILQLSACIPKGGRIQEVQGALLRISAGPKVFATSTWFQGCAVAPRQDSPFEIKFRDVYWLARWVS